MHYKVIFKTHKASLVRSRKFIEQDAATNKGSIGNGGTRCFDPFDSAKTFWLGVGRANLYFWDTQDPMQLEWKLHRWYSA